MTNSSRFYPDGWARFLRPKASSDLVTATLTHTDFMDARA